jgi:hypothetical protein
MYARAPEGGPSKLLNRGVLLRRKCRLLADSVAKVPKRRVAKFPLNDKTSGNRRFVGC